MAVKYFTDEKNTLVILSLLKAHGINKVVASPGATNLRLVASMQLDPYFEIYSSVDERSAAYIACGLAAELKEPVVLSCTGATASRNYFPGLTEAFYRKLPVLAITSTQAVSKVGHHIAQVIDRSSMPNDIVKLSVTLPIIKDDDDLWECETKTNQAILELKRNGGGPVHINLPTTYSRNFDVKELPSVRKIDRITVSDSFPDLPKGKVAIFIGSHTVLTDKLTNAIDRFCAVNNGLVFCDHTSNYKGKYRILFALAACQQMVNKEAIRPDLLIHIGEITGDYYTLGISGTQVWRVNEDGEIRDTFRKLRCVFEMPELTFFEQYALNADANKDDYFQSCKSFLDDLNNKLPELPFSNIWVASQMADLIPKGSTIHFGILNSLRSWNFFEIDQSVTSSSNVGGFGIDGCVSSLIGASLANKNKIYFGVVGDLAFFYDMNAIGNRHVGNNLRVMVVNNGKGVEFRQFDHPAADLGQAADQYVAAAGHYGNKSDLVLKHLAQDFGFEYLTASNKEEFNNIFKRFLTDQITESPMLFEVFTDGSLESDALELMMNIETSLKGKAKQMARQVLGNDSLKTIKKVIKRG